MTDAADRDGTFAAAVDRLAPWGLVEPFLDRLRVAAPPRVAASLAALGDLSIADWQQVCGEVARTPVGEPGAGPAATFVAEAMLQPFAEAWAAGVPGAPIAGPDALCCPRCGGRAVAGVLRERGHGAGRSLVCGLCASEWSVPRVVCPACGESRVEALPVFRDGDLPAVRLDTCDTCRVYIKAVDLTVDGRLDPIVDDLATPALDLWAGSQGYHRLRPNLLRL
jgi:FdhE protein